MWFLWKWWACAMINIHSVFGKLFRRHTQKPASTHPTWKYTDLSILGVPDLFIYLEGSKILLKLKFGVFQLDCDFPKTKVQDPVQWVKTPHVFPMYPSLLPISWYEADSFLEGTETQNLTSTSLFLTFRRLAFRAEQAMTLSCHVPYWLSWE